ncbi:hypothetical protein [Mycobacterium sp.]|uniref:hypothetical protein n=1 Tax=Mycobacterium sp. TaxID=1785 RepID=UPI0025D482FA|nr:hypothetical protein [Mycobacterium sp.]
MTTFIKGAVSAMIQEGIERDENSDTPGELESTTGRDAALEEAPTDGPKTRRKSRVLTYGVLPAVALLLTLAAGYLKWVAGSADDLTQARAESVRAAREDAVALLSYKADSVEKDLGAARERLTGDFKDAYTDLTRQVVIPGAKEKHINAIAKVNSAAPVSVTPNHAVALLFVDQTVTIGDGAPTDTQPVIRVTLDKVNGRWLVSHFDPV